MNRMLKDATVYHYYDTHQQLREHLQTFLMAYYLAKRQPSAAGMSQPAMLAHAKTNCPAV